MLKRALASVAVVVVVGLLSFVVASCSDEATGGGGGGKGEFVAQANPVPACGADFFDKSALVFDTVLICGTNGVPVDKLQHAANVAAVWLDNNRDSRVDEQRLIDTFKESKPVLVMSANGFPDSVIRRAVSALPKHQLQDLGAFETNPAGGERDASQEEIHHLIINAGWQRLFPNVFSEDARDNSTLYKAWKFANDNGYYAYGDPSCDDSCKVTEFVYLATATYLGSQADLQTDELSLKTRTALNVTIPQVVQIFTSSEYSYPTNHWPDGTYKHQSNIAFNPS